MALCALALVTSAACGDTVTVNETEKGGLGESCRARNDCEADLVCRDNVCSQGAQGDDGDGGAGPAASQVRGGEGESCQRRADCEAELACIDNVCTPEAEGDAGMGEPAATRGKRGESCQATSDCEGGLVCIAMRCRQADVEVEYASKACDQVQCEADADCCENFVPFYPASTCDMWKSSCDADPVLNASFCDSHRSYCMCAQECADERCVAYTYCDDDAQCSGPCVDNHCTQCGVDLDCLGSQVCVGNACVQCRNDDDCPGADDACVEGVCDGGCSRDEQCGLFEKCMDRECVDVGCETDRQCFFYTGDERSTCADGDCVTPCDNDAECVGNFQVCQEGVCRFVGCENDQECRAYFSSVGGNLNGYEAVCREPMQ